MTRFTAAGTPCPLNKGRARLLAGAALALSGTGAAWGQTDPAAATPATQAEATPPAADPALSPAGSSGAQEVVVTGSRIRRAPIIDQPVQELGADQIEKRGYTNLGTALQELPGFSVPASSPVGGQSSFSAGQTYVNLYNLGAQRTLSLVNGHRFVSSATSSIFGPVAGSPIDYAQLPTNLVERVETVSVGGAPIYGSDAIAGTVNVILKKDFNGVNLQAQSGIAETGQGQNFNFAGLFGHNFAEGRGNITVSAQYDRQYGIPYSDIKYLNGSSPFFGTAADANAGYTYQLYRGGQRYNLFTSAGIPLLFDDIPINRGMPYAAVTNAAGQALTFNNAGQLVPFVNGQLTGSSIYQAGGDGFPIRETGNFLNSSYRFQTVALAHYDLTDHLKLSGEAWFGRNDSTNLRAQPFYNTAIFNSAGLPTGNLVLSTDNPYLNPADRATIVSALTAAQKDPSTFLLTRANTDLATGTFTSRSDIYRFVGGLNGDFSIGTHAFNYEVTATYGHSHTVTTSNEVVVQNYLNALDAVRDASGAIVCRPGYTNATIATYSSTCAPLDLFGVGQASKAATDYITTRAKPIQNNSQLDVVADIQGSIVTLPAGDVKFSLGYEHRREAVNFDPGVFNLGEDNGDGTRTPYGNGSAVAPVAGAFHTDEAFGELDIPVVSADMHVPLIHSLDINGAGRFVHNSLTRSGFWTYTGGGTYAPVGGLTVRGNFTRSFRAPAITEAFAPTSQVFDFANDPCDRRYINGGPNPSRRAANCAAAGIAQPFTSSVVDATGKGLLGGNPNLQNETANSWTAGGVLQPRFIRGLSVSADYVSIDISNEIATLNLTNLMDACYDAADYPNSFCSSFTRDASGQVTTFLEGNYNIGIESFRGLQSTVSYVFPLSRVGLPESAGTLGLTVNYLHTFKHYFRVGTGDNQYKLGSVQEPADNFTANFNYDNHGFNILWQTIFYGPTKIDPNVEPSTYQYPRVHKYFMYNVAIGKDLGRYSLRLTINNVLNKHIPFPYSLDSANSNSVVRYYDALLGRSFKVTAGVKF